jgi:hypothetical protein
MATRPVGIELDVKLNLAKTKKDITTFQKMSQGMFNLVKKGASGASSAGKGFVDFSRGLGAASKEYKEVAAQVKKFDFLIKEQSKTLKTASKEDQEAINANIKTFGEEKKVLEERVKSMKGGSKILTIGLKFKEMGKKAGEWGKEFVDPFKKGVDDGVDAFKSFMSKDFAGAFKKGFSSGGKIFEGIFKGGGKITESVGGKASGWGDKLMNKGGAMKAAGGSKVGGGALQGLGAGMKMFGEFSKGLGPLLKAVGSIGPLLSTLGGVVVGLVKLFLDAEAAAKDFNRGILESAGTSSFFSDAMGNSSAAVFNLNKELDTMRGQALSLENIDWGIDKDQFKGVINTLTQEGVSLKRLRQEFTNAGKDGKGFAQNYASTVQMVVAYSRNFGVSTQEIGQAQSEMMTEMGQSLKGVEQHFYSMQRTADDSGIASNKFFQMIRGVSSDLSLYNVRIEDTVKLLGQLGKIMNPRNAQKFMQFAMNAMKGMSTIDRLKVGRMGGVKKFKETTEKDIASKADSLADDIAKATGENTGELARLLKSGKKEDMDTIQEIISKKAPSEGRGALSEAASMLQIRQTAMKKGEHGVAFAAGDSGPIAQLQGIRDAIMMNNKGSTLMEAAGNVDQVELAKMTNTSEENLKQMMIFEQAMERFRKTLSDKETTVEGKKAVAGMDMQALFNKMSKEDQKKWTDAGKPEDAMTFAKKQTEIQTSIWKKLEMLTDVMMEKIYQVMMGLWKSVLTIWSSLGPAFGGNAAKDELQKMGLKEEMFRKNDIQGLKALAESGGSLEDFKTSLVKTMGGIGKTITNVASGTKTIEDLDRLIGTSKLMGEDTKKYEVQRQAEVERLAPEKAKAEVFEKSLSEFVSKTSDKGAEAVLKTAPLASLGDDYEAHKKKEAVQKDIESGMDIKSALKKGGFDESAIHLAMKQLMENLSAEDLASFARTQKPVTTAPAAPTTPVITPTGPTFGPPGAPTPKTVETSTSVTPWTGQTAAPVSAASPMKKTEEKIEVLNENMDETNDVLKNKGIKINKTFVDTTMKDMTSKGVLEAVRKALFEYYLYKDLSQQSVMNAMKSGSITPENLGATLTDRFATGTTSDQAITMSPNAMGGLVTGVSNGLAMVQAPMGEGLASIGAGERIMPAGGGGGAQVIELRLKGDLGRLIEARAQNVVAKNESMKRMR